MSEEKNLKQKEYTEDELKEFVPLCIEGIRENTYEINRLGEIRRIDNQKILSGCIVKESGYKVVKLCTSKNSTHRKTFKIHRLVALTFIKNPKKYNIIDHIDRQRDNNTVTNLRWVSYSDNSKNIDKDNISFAKNKKVFTFIKKDNNGKIIEKLSEKDILSKKYSKELISRSIRQNKEYKGFFWEVQRTSFDLDEYLNKYSISLDDVLWKEWSDPTGNWKVLCSKEGLFKREKGDIVLGSLVKEDIGMGYRRISIVGSDKRRKGFFCHRIVYECWSGERIGPKEVIDHISTERGDNRFENLKKCTVKENLNNKITLLKKGKCTIKYDCYGNFLDKKLSTREYSEDESYRYNISRSSRGKLMNTWDGFIWCYEGNEHTIPERVGKIIFCYKTKEDKVPKAMLELSYPTKCGKDIKNCILTGQPHPKTGYYYSLGLKNWETGEQIIPDVTPKLEEENKK